MPWIIHMKLSSTPDDLIEIDMAIELGMVHSKNEEQDGGREV